MQDSVASTSPPYALGDVPPEVFRASAHRAADLIADYLSQVGAYPVTPALRPGDIRRLLPPTPPLEGEPLEQILDDYKVVIEPNTTHWNHPGFFAYFAITGSAPGILGEMLAAGLNVNAMLWQTGPAATELEEHVCDWLRQMVGLPTAFVGHINDTASIGTLNALAAAREQARPAVRQRGLQGNGREGSLVVYCSEHAHSSVDKAAIALGIGLDFVRRIRADDAFRMRVDELERAIRADRAQGLTPCAVVATAGTTSTTSVDPLPDLAAICRREGMWYHVDAAYAGAAAVCPEHRALLAGWGEADSIVINPHKWLFTPIDCSVLYVRRPERLCAAFRVVPEYLRTAQPHDVTNLMDYGVQLGRRFRALKLWMVIRAFGVGGLQARIRQHCALARQFAAWVDRTAGFELIAPVEFSVVCFRGTADLPPGGVNALNERLLGKLNADGSVFLSHTKLEEKYVLRLAIGNLRTTREHVDRVQSLLQREYNALQGAR